MLNNVSYHNWVLAQRLSLLWWNLNYRRAHAHRANEHKDFVDLTEWREWRTLGLVHVTFEERSNFQQQSRLQVHIHFFKAIDGLGSIIPRVFWDATNNLNNIRRLQVDEATICTLVHNTELLRCIWQFPCMLFRLL